MSERTEVVVKIKCPFPITSDFKKLASILDKMFGPLVMANEKSIGVEDGWFCCARKLGQTPPGPNEKRSRRKIPPAVPPNKGEPDSPRAGEALR